MIVKSLNSLDLLGCMYLTSLVEDSVRTRIMSRFDELVRDELVELDVSFRRRLYRTGQDDHLRAGMFRGACPECGHEFDSGVVRSTSLQNMTFENLHQLLSRQQSGHTLNNVQSATISLVKAAKTLETADTELAALRADQDLLARARTWNLVAAETPGRPAEDFLLDRYIVRQESEIVDIRERLRGSIASVDSELTQMAIAFEDDVNTQFYRRAMRDIRRAATHWKIKMGQLESTSVLTGDRTIARVSPGQTLQFDLPHRPILAKEVFDSVGAIALESEGIARRFAAQSAADSAGAVGGVVADSVGLTAPGTYLQRLVPRGDGYSVESNNELEITPIIQPDGKSIAYRLLYPYRTIVHGPPGTGESSRVVRHFIDTEVQTTAYEFREISRFRVGIQASRGTRGVPILEDLPLAGKLFQTRPSRITSVQDTIIMADCVIYPSILSVTGTNWLEPTIFSSKEKSVDMASIVKQDSLLRGEVISDTRSRVQRVLQQSGLQPSAESPTSLATSKPLAPAPTMNVFKPADPVPTSTTDQGLTRVVGNRPSTLPPAKTNEPIEVKAPHRNGWSRAEKR